jgi:hypothetical protein
VDGRAGTGGSGATPRPELLRETFSQATQGTPWSSPWTVFAATLNVCRVKRILLYALSLMILNASWYAAARAASSFPCRPRSSTASRAGSLTPLFSPSEPKYRSMLSPSAGS